jgi:hypothetical protein
VTFDVDVDETSCRFVAQLTQDKIHIKTASSFLLFVVQRIPQYTDNANLNLPFENIQLNWQRGIQAYRLMGGILKSRWWYELMNTGSGIEKIIRCWGGGEAKHAAWWFHIPTLNFTWWWAYKIETLVEMTSWVTLQQTISQWPRQNSRLYPTEAVRVWFPFKSFGICDIQSDTWAGFIRVLSISLANYSFPRLFQIVIFCHPGLIKQSDEWSR